MEVIRGVGIRAFRGFQKLEKIGENFFGDSRQGGIGFGELLRGGIGSKREKIIGETTIIPYEKTRAFFQRTDKEIFLSKER